MTNIRVERGSLRTRLLAWGAAYTPAAVLAVVLPKCPLCIAAQLALIGVTIPLPTHARAITIAISVVLGSAVLWMRRKRRGASCACQQRCP
jgi:hypothetical protein